MCGIAGFWSPSRNGGEAALQQTANAMGLAVAHRGPDGDGVWVDAAHGIGFAHRRLAIIDLKETGHQPMVSPTGRYVISYNGEIYNFPELRTELEGGGFHRKPWPGAGAGTGKRHVRLRAVGPRESQAIPGP